MICNMQSQLKPDPESCNCVEITGFCTYLVVILELSVAQRNLVPLKERDLELVFQKKHLTFIADLNRNSIRFFPLNMKET